MALLCIYYRMKVNFWQEKHKIYFIGIGGISMSGLALHLHSCGFSVFGSDQTVGEITADLERRGIRVFGSPDARHVQGMDAVVYTSAVPDTHAELSAARSSGIPTIERAELLRLVASDYEHVVGVAGCHGKTTATAMCAHVLLACSGNCSAHIGGLDMTFGNFYEGGNKYFVTEACEYRGNFLKLQPEVALFLNTGTDHLECYGSREALCRANRLFVTGAKAAVVCGDDEIAGQVKPALTFGLSPGCDVSAVSLRSVRGRYSFQPVVRGETSERIRLHVYGRHNVLNALAAVAVAHFYGYPIRFAAEGLRAFRGIRRRFERIGKINGGTVIADYAHHPQEIAATLATAKEICRGNLYVIFQPHTYSRTRYLFEDFVSVLSGVEHLVVYKTFAAREYFDAAGSALTLSEHLPRSLYVETVRELGIYLRCSLQAGDVALVLGAGDIYYAAGQIVHRYGG